MRAAWLIALVACGNTGGTTPECSDSACSPNICTRNGECDAPADVRTLHVRWTVHGMPASATTCASFEDLELDFLSDFGDSFGFAPVPCMQGSFTIDRIPRRFSQVELSSATGAGVSAFVDGNDTVTFDLNF